MKLREQESTRGAKRRPMTMTAWRALLHFMRSRSFKVLAALGVVGFAAGVWMLLHPAAFWLQPWRPETSQVSTRFIFGPYPIEKDFENLELRGVTTIVSLLDPSLPYEKILLAQETELAQQHHMRVLNFPMASILGHAFGEDYLKNSRAAADAAIASEGVVYLHCYLGLHRAANVRRLLKEHADSALYEGTVKSTRTPDKIALERAGMAFRAGDMPEVLREINSMSVKTDGAKRLEAWASYRLGNTEKARENFASIVSQAPDDPEALGGLGYVALKCNDLDTAEQQFSRVLWTHPDDVSALEGLGHVRYRQDRRDEARAKFSRVHQLTSDDEGEAAELLERLQPVPPPTLLALGLLLFGFAMLAAEMNAVLYLRRLELRDELPLHWPWSQVVAAIIALVLGAASTFSQYSYRTSEIYGIPFPWGGVDMGLAYGGGPSKMLPTVANFMVWFLAPYLMLSLVLRLEEWLARQESEPPL